MNNKYKLDIKKIHEAITSGERFGLEEIYHQLTDRGYSWDNNDNVKEIEALISLYDFVYFCETSYDNYFSNKFSVSWDFYADARDKVLDNLDIGKVACDENEYQKYINLNNIEI